MNGLLAAVEPYGLYAIIIAVLFYMVMRMQDKLFSVVEKNTKAFIELRDTIKELKRSTT
jgi:hypothetical protein